MKKYFAVFSLFVSGMLLLCGFSEGSLPSLVKPLGIATYSLVMITVISGFFRKKIKFSLWFKIHRVSVYTIAVLASLHALLVYLYYY